MKALLFENIGLPQEVLQLKEIDQPIPGPGEICVKISKANIVPADIMFIRGMYGLRPHPPQIGGFEACGVVESCGDGVEMPEGSKVIFTQQGVWAEYVCVAANTVIPQPPALSDQVACQAFINPLTAYGMLIKADLEEGDFLLITAAASAFSKFVIQFASQRGIHVIGTVRRDEQKEELLALGAHTIINEQTEKNFYKAVKNATGGIMPKSAFDAVGGELGDKILNCLQNGGMLQVYGLLSLQPIPLNSGLLIFKDLRVQGFWLTTWFMSLSGDERRSIIPKILGMLIQNELKADVEAEYRLEDWSKAISHMEGSGRKGKILFDFN